MPNDCVITYMQDATAGGCCTRACILPQPQPGCDAKHRWRCKRHTRIWRHPPARLQREAPGPRVRHAAAARASHPGRSQAAAPLPKAASFVAPSKLHIQLPVVLGKCAVVHGCVPARQPARRSCHVLPAAVAVVVAQAGQRENGGRGGGQRRLRRCVCVWWWWGLSNCSSLLARADQSQALEIQGSGALHCEATPLAPPSRSRLPVVQLRVLEALVSPAWGAWWRCRRRRRRLPRQPLLLGAVGCAPPRLVAERLAVLLGLWGSSRWSCQQTRKA